MPGAAGRSTPCVDAAYPDGKKKPRNAGLFSYRFIEPKNSSLDLVFFILSSRNSIAAISSIGCSTELL